MTIYRGPGGSGDATNDATVTAVAAYAAQAATSATNAANSATTSGTSATNSANSASSAAASASAAANSASQAASSQSAAATSATTAASSATSAGTQATNATTQANNAANSATAAATSASSASTSATNAATSASQAATSATNASNSAASALAIYGNTTAMNNAVTSATNSASAAATSASQAAASANDASDEATQAGIYAGQAASSASAAANSAANSQAAVGDALALYGSAAALQTAVTNAQTSATQSANSATASSASSSAAQTSANSAATSATNAANSATQAANSAASAAAIVTGVASNRPSIRPSLLLDFQYTKQLDPRITFSRPTTAAYYDGKTVVKAEQNYAYDSQSIGSSYWTKGNINTTLNAMTAPDGTSTASLIVPTTTSAAHYIHNAGTYNGIAGLGVFTYSVYAKSSGYSWVALNIYDNVDYVTYFDITNGVVGTNATGNTATITSIGSGWYRCSITRNCAITSQGGSSCVIYACNADNSRTFTGDGTSGVYIWGAQLEQRSTVTAYTPTTTAAITNYIPALQTAVSNDARFDHDPVTGESKGLLIEEQRTNLLTYSDDFANSVWVKSGGSNQANTMIAPDGSLTADMLIEDTSTGGHVYQYSYAFSATSYNFSVYLKANGRTAAVLRHDASGAAIAVDLSAGTAASVNGSPSNVICTAVGNGWYRCGFSVTSTATTNFLSIFAANAATYAGRSYTGDGRFALYIWGAQLEAGSFPTSYIPTVASQVTRSADSASMTGSNFSSWFDIAQGTLYGEAYFNNSASYPAIASISDGTNTNRTWLQASGTQIVTANGSTITLGASATSGAFNKYSLSYAASNYGSSNNGAAAATNTLVNVPANETQMLIGSTASGNYIGGTIKRIAYYPKRLSNVELQGLTS